MEEILKKIEELKSLGVSVSVDTLYNLQQGNHLQEFDEFKIHPGWSEGTLITELDKKIIEIEKRPWLAHLKRKTNLPNLCDDCVNYNFVYRSTMESSNIPIKFGTCSVKHFSDQKDIPNIKQCKDYERTY
jgi:hypothetical protein